MLFYSIFAYIVVGIFLSICIIKANETKKGWCADKSGFDYGLAVTFFIIFLCSPFALPLGVFIWIIYKSGKFIYDRFVKEKDLQ